MKRKGNTIYKKSGPCVDCENCMPYESGTAFGRCMETGETIHHVDAYADHGCFCPGKWFGHAEEDDYMLADL